MDAVTRQQFLETCLALGAGRSAAWAENAGQSTLVPAVKQFYPRSGVCLLAGRVPFEATHQAGLADCGAQLALGSAFELAPGPAARRGIRLQIGDPRTPGDVRGAYRLVVGKDQIAITARSSEALLMALRTIAQMAQQGPLPQCEVLDWPDATSRSAHLCYHLVRESMPYNAPNFPALLQQVDALAALKYNGVLLELESLFPYRRHPGVSCKIAFTPEQIETLRSRLAAHRMEIVPLVQCLGHAYNVLIHDEYAAYREVPGTYQQYCPLNPDLPRLYMDFVDEYLELFPGLKQWHMGGDESRQLALCPRCKEKAATQGISRLYIDHVAGIARRLLKRGLQPLIWSDMMEHYPDALALLPDSVKIVYWNYDLPKWPRPYAAGLFRKRGLSVAGAPGVRFGSTGTELSIYYLAALRGLGALIPRMRHEGTSEFIVTNWTKGSPHENAHYGFAYAAELCWNTSTSRQQFDLAYARTTFGLKDSAVCRLYEMLSVPLPYAEPVQNHMPNRLNRLDVSGLRFPEKWKIYSSPERQPQVIEQLRKALVAATEARKLVRTLAPLRTSGRREFELLDMSAECIIAKAEFGLALHEGPGRWRAELPRIQAAWQAAKKRHAELLEPAGFPPCIQFLNDLMFEPAEYEFLERIARRSVTSFAMDPHPS